MKRSRERSKESSKRTTFSDSWDQIGLQLAGRLDARRGPARQPFLHRGAILRAVRLVACEHAEQRTRPALLAGRVGLAGAHQRRGDVVAVQRRGLHDEAAAEQLAHQRLEDHGRGEERLRPVAHAGQPLDVLARRLPDRVLLPGLLVHAALEALDLAGQLEVVEDEVLREAQLVRGGDGQRVVDHVGRRVALGRDVDVHADPVLGVRPGGHVALEDLHPRAVDGREGPGRLGVGDGLLHLAHDRRVVAVDRLLPLLVGIEELVPVGGLQRGPLLRVAGGAVGEGVDPALGQVALGIGLDVDGDVLVDRRPPLARREVVVSCGSSRTGTRCAPASASVNTGFGTLRSLTGLSVAMCWLLLSRPRWS